MLTKQTKRLRETADEVKRIKDNNVDWLWRDAITLDDAVKEMREAADTIENLRNRLTETCRNVAEYPEDGFWPSPHFKCDVCGATHVSMEYVHYCPNCGRKVVD